MVMCVKPREDADPGRIGLSQRANGVFKKHTCFDKACQSGGILDADTVRAEGIHSNQDDMRGRALFVIDERRWIVVEEERKTDE